MLPHPGFADVVEWGALGRMALLAVIAGIGVVTAFSLFVLGSARVHEARRAGEHDVGWWLLVVVGLIGTGAAIVVALGVVLA